MCQLGSVRLDPAALVHTEVSVLHLCGGAEQTLVQFEHDVSRALFNAQPFTGWMGEGVKGKEDYGKKIFIDFGGNGPSGLTGDYL